MTEPTTDVAVPEPTQVVEHRGNLSEQMRYAQALAQAGLLPAAYRKQPANVLLAMEYAAALQVPNMTVIQGVHIVDGKPTASSALVGALVRKAGHRLRVTGDDRRAVCEITRADDPDFVFRSEWTIERAQAAGLTGKGTWKQYPSNMLKARAITECARDACPEALSGVQYTPEELGADVPDDWSPQTGAGGGNPGGEAFDEAAVVGSNPTASTPPASEVIHDAEVVEDAGDAGAGEGPASPVHPETAGRFTRMQILLKERFGDDRPTAWGWIGLQIGRDITSTKDLDAREVAHVVAVMEGRKAEAATA